MPTYHRRATVSRNGLALAGSGLGAGLVDGQVTSNSPLRAAEGLSSLIQLRGHVEVVDSRLAAILAVKADQGVDLQVSEVQVDVNGVEAREEVDKRLLLALRDVYEQSLLDGFPRWEGRSDRKVENQGLRVDIADVDTALVGEQDGVALTLRVDANVELGVRWVRQEGLENEVVQSTGDGLDLCAASN